MTDHRLCLVDVGRVRSLVIEALFACNCLAHSLVRLWYGLGVHVKAEDGEVKQAGTFLFL